MFPTYQLAVDQAERFFGENWWKVCQIRLSPSISQRSQLTRFEYTVAWTTPVLGRTRGQCY